MIPTFCIIIDIILVRKKAYTKKGRRTAAFNFENADFY